MVPVICLPKPPGKVCKIYTGLCEGGIFIKIRKEAEATFGCHLDKNKEESLNHSKEAEFGRAGKPEPEMVVRAEAFPGMCRPLKNDTGHF